eukprot:SAG22_NODE_13960_length_389_cov_1.175862_1_plen_55_part_10
MIWPLASLQFAGVLMYAGSGPGQSQVREAARKGTVLDRKTVEAQQKGSASLTCCT